MDAASLEGVKNIRRGILQFWLLVRLGQPSLKGIQTQRQITFPYTRFRVDLLAKVYTASYKNFVPLRIIQKGELPANVRGMFSSVI